MKQAILQKMLTTFLDKDIRALTGRATTPGRSAGNGTHRIKRASLVSLVAGILLISTVSQAQEVPPFYPEIVAFERQDSLQPPPAHTILFIGSSSFAKWKDVQDYFPGYPILNRGFGGSSLPDLIRYTGVIILPYRPKQIVIYCGDNDFASGDQVTVDGVVELFKKLFWIIRKGLPNAAIDFISIKPSPSRTRQMKKEEAANKKIRSFLGHQANASFIDVYHPMLGANGQPIASLFLSDSLHMNPSGYAIWKKAIEPYLLK